MGIFQRFRERRRHKTSKSITSAEAVDILMKSLESDAPPRVWELSILVCELVGTASLSEWLAPGDFAEMLSRYSKIITESVKKEAGMIDRSSAESVMAYWGTSSEHSDYAERAFRTAIRCREEIASLSAEYKHRFDRSLQVRFGIASGQTAVGWIGGPHRKQWSIVGKPVHYAREFSQGCKSFDVDILCDSASRNAAKATNRDLDFRALGNMLVKGREKPLDVFELVDV